jgi:hypothetical protein
MFLKLTCFLLMTSLIGCWEPIQFVKYRQIWNTTVIDSSQTSLKLVDSFKVSEIIFCPVRCNRLSGCQAATINSSNHCTLYSDQITTLDLKAENGTLMLANKPIRECLNPDYFADMNQKVCKAKFTESITCTRDGECSDSRGLVCSGGACKCKNPVYK